MDSSRDGTADLIAREFPRVMLFRYSERKFPGDARNIGVCRSTGDIIAFTDADCCAEPGWGHRILKAHEKMQHPVIGGAVVNGNPESYVGWAHYFAEFNQWMPQAKSCEMAETLTTCLTVKRRIFEKSGPFIENTYCSEYRTELGRTCAGSFLYKALDQSGAVMLLQPNQRVVHRFSLRWWVLRLHRRFGYEVFLLRRLDPADPKQWLLSVTLIEPLLTMVWHVLLDVPQWLRFSELLRVPLLRRLMLIPVVIGMSLLARGSEMIGMYQTIAAPAAMKRFAESN